MTGDSKSKRMLHVPFRPCTRPLKAEKALTTFAAFQEAAKHAPDAAKEWMHRLQALDGKQIDDVLQRIPQGWMSSIAKDFTRELLNINRINIVNMDIKP